LILKEILKDIDIVAVAAGIELALQVAALLPNKPKVQVFKNYGTAMLRYEDTEIEFVGARKESYHFESRNLWLKTDRFRTIKIVVILL
jgi:tRNA nucleotidyltransferase (CCA-adding enzyme)